MRPATSGVDDAVVGRVEPAVRKVGRVDDHVCMYVSASADGSAETE